GIVVTHFRQVFSARQYNQFQLMRLIITQTRTT
ncbi:MAG: hypothetical protein ACI90G_002743, partial [Urechidicola sp.]